MTRRIAINTGGGDAPGLNAVIRAVVLSAISEGWEVYGIRDGFADKGFDQARHNSDIVLASFLAELLLTFLTSNTFFTP